VGGKLHTARSRNDQVALDMRLYLRDCALDFIFTLSSLIHTLIARLENIGRSSAPDTPTTNLPR